MESDETNTQTNKQANTQTNVPEWLKLEHEIIEENKPNFDERDSLQFEEGKITVFEIDFSEPFDKWVDPDEDKVIKKIIPVAHEGEQKVLWLNVRNPLYSELVSKGIEGITLFKVLQTGNNKKTRYTLVE